MKPIRIPLSQADSRGKIRFIYEQVAKILAIDLNSIVIYNGGKALVANFLQEYAFSSEFLRVSLKNGIIKGGKGGFGSLLRSMNPKKQPTDNFDACRDLSGRRIRTVQNE